jgi:hypothetical protein
LDLLRQTVHDDLADVEGLTAKPTKTGRQRRFRRDAS